MALFRSRGYPVGSSNGYLFDVADGDGKGVVGPRTTQIAYPKVYYWIDGDGFLFIKE